MATHQHTFSSSCGNIRCPTDHDFLTSYLDGNQLCGEVRRLIRVLPRMMSSAEKRVFLRVRLAVGRYNAALPVAHD